MAKAKQQPQKTLYHSFFCGDNVGEADGFFEVVGGELELVDCWSTNDAHWRHEYMNGILKWAGVDLQKLPAKYLAEAEKLLEKTWGLDGDDSEDDGDITPDHEGEQETAELYFREGTSDKVYNLSIAASAVGAWKVVAEYGRNGGKLKEETKGTGLDYDDAKDIYDRVLAEKLKKGYKQAN